MHPQEMTILKIAGLTLCCLTVALVWTELGPSLAIQNAPVSEPPVPAGKAMEPPVSTHKPSEPPVSAETSAVAFIKLRGVVALWDWYFGPGAARCDHIGMLPEIAVAVGNGLPIAAAKPMDMLAWFARHPQYQEEISRQRRFMERTCRPD
jgi:hypothetical protein